MSLRTGKTKGEGAKHFPPNLKEGIMKKILIFMVMMMLISLTSYAARNQATTTTYNSSQLIKRFEGKIYYISFVATSNGGDFILYDAVSDVKGFSAVKAEGSEATSLNSHSQDYSDKPLEFTTGLYLVITTGYIVITYE